MTRQSRNGEAGDGQPTGSLQAGKEVLEGRGTETAHGPDAKAGVRAGPGLQGPPGAADPHGGSSEDPNAFKKGKGSQSSWSLADGI